MSKQADREKQEAIAQLREWLKPGDTVYTILDHVSSSGMSRAIRVVIPYTREDGTIDHLHPNYAVGKALGLRHWKRHGREQDALVVGGCGMDMGFHLVYELSSVLYGGRRCSQCGESIPYDYPTDVTCGKCDGAIVGGYACLGKGKCPSNYHVNHRDRIRCEGVDGRFCFLPIGDGATIPGRLLACLAGSGEDGKPYEVCPTCKGAGDLPNPEGPERFDLVHTDGYALRHRWL